MSNNNTKKLYLAGKVTGLPEAEVEQKFNEAQLVYEKLGFEVFNPHKLVKDAGFDNCSWEEIMKFCLIMMLGCDGVVLLHDWRESHGALLERDIALQLRMPLYYPHEPFDKPLELL